MKNMSIDNVLIMGASMVGTTEIILDTQEVTEVEKGSTTELNTTEGQSTEGEEVGTESGLNGEDSEITTVEGEVEEGTNIDEVSNETASDGEMGIDIGIGDGNINSGIDDVMNQDTAMTGTEAVVKDPFLSSWPGVIGISSAVLLVSIFLGALLASRKIKKGIDLYED